MGWQIRNTAGTTVVDVFPVSGDIVIEHQQPSTVLWPLRGSAPYVDNREQRLPAITVPPLEFASKVEFDRFVALVGTGVRLVLADDMGGEWPVKVVDGLKTALLDTADRAAKPRYRVEVAFVGVA